MSEPPDPGGSRYSIRVEDPSGARTDHLERLAAHVLRALGVPLGASLDVTLVAEQRIAELKERFFGARERTDVLAFGVDDPASPSPGPVVLGDVVICPDVAARQARALGRRPEDEISLLLVHGILHLCGRDHSDPAGERAMALEERDLLGAFRRRVAS